MATLRAYLSDLNLFHTNTAHDPELNEQTKRLTSISTRVYILSLILALIALAFAIWLSPFTTPITLQRPTQAQFEAIPHNPYCPCSHGTLSYSDFVSLRADFHQLCSSDFVSDRWIRAIFSGANSTSYLPYDFRNQGSAVFLALASFCRLSKERVRQNILSFQTSAFTSSQAMSKPVLISQASATSEQFRSTLPNEFKAQLHLLQELNIGNQLLSALHTSMRPKFRQATTSSAIEAFIQYVTYEGDKPCHCYKDISCSGIPLAMIDVFGAAAEQFHYNASQPIQMIIPGLQAACTPIDSLLGSSLECFYNQTCVNKLLSFFPTNETFTALVASSTSHFPMNATITSIIDHLLVEQWHVDISYADYHTQCAPLSCAYVESARRSATFVLTKLIGILSGLMLALQSIIPLVINFLLKKKPIVAAPKIPRESQILIILILSPVSRYRTLCKQCL